MDEKIKILLVEDNPGDRRLFEEYLDFTRYNVTNAASLHDAISLLSEKNFDLIVLDLSLPDSKGYETFNKLYNIEVEIPILVLTGNDDHDLGRTLIRTGAQEYLSKRYTDEYTLEKAIDYSITRFRMQLLIKNKEKNFRDILENNIDGMIVLDNSGIIQYVNPSAEKLLGISEYNLINEYIGTVLEEETTQVNVISKNNKILTIQKKLFNAHWNHESVRVLSLRDITDIDDQRKKIIHLNKLLKTIHNINSLIVIEKNKDKLLQSVCDLIIEGMEYNFVWLGIIDDNRKISNYFHSSLVKENLPPNNIPINLDSPEFMNRLLNSKDVIKLDSSGSDELQFNDADNHHETVSKAILIHHFDEKYCVLVVNDFTSKHVDREEDELLLEIGADIGLALHSIDVDKKEVKMRKELMWLTEAIKSSANSFILTDKSGIVIWANPACIELTGYKPEELMGKNLRILNSGKHKKQFYENMWETIKGGNVWSGEIINKRKNGELYYEDMTITPVKDSNGIISSYIAVKMDITQRINAEKKIEESEERFRNLYENATIGIYRSTEDGRILMANPAFMEMFEFDSFDELTNKFNSLDLYKNPNDRSTYIKILKEEGVIYNFESQVITRKGNHISTKESAKIIYDSEGGIKFFEGIVTDITKEKIAEEKLKLAKDKAEQSDRLKSEFLAQMSHEIRTPLNAILSYTSLIHDEFIVDSNEETKDYFTGLKLVTNRLMRTIDLTLNMSEVQMDTYEYKQKLFDVHKDIIAPILKELNLMIKEKKIQVSVNLSTKDTFVYLDEYSVYQIFLNLIDNAVKYTKKGRVDINIGKNSEQKLEIEIVDTGIGIAQEFLPKLFELFSQEEQGYTRSYDGNGLGLALVKKYCDMNNASISVESEKGIGSTFRVTFDN